MIKNILQKMNRNRLLKKSFTILPYVPSPEALEAPMRARKVLEERAQSPQITGFRLRRWRKTKLRS